MKKGSSHFLAQRVSALLLIPLLPWFCFALASLPNSSRADVAGWLHSPVNALALVAFIIVGSYHGALGMQVIVEDYVSPGVAQRILLLAGWAAAIGMMALGPFFIFQIFSGP